MHPCSKNICFPTKKQLFSYTKACFSSTKKRACPASNSLFFYKQYDSLRKTAAASFNMVFPLQKRIAFPLQKTVFLPLQKTRLFPPASNSLFPFAQPCFPYT